MDLKFDQNINLHLPFLTPVATFILPNAEEIGKVLESAILLREAEDGSFNRSNQGGWHSAPDRAMSAMIGFDSDPKKRGLDNPSTVVHAAFGPGPLGAHHPPDALVRLHLCSR